MSKLRDKKALITGAASGIGRHVALQLAAIGVKIVALDVNVDGLADLKQEIHELGGECHTLICDLSQESQIESAANETMLVLGGLDILVNNAGIGFHGYTHEMTPEERIRVIQVNLQAPFSLFQHLIHPLLHSQGHVVNVSSIFGLVPYQKTTAYCASKYGLVGLSEAIRAEYGRWGLGVTLVCPGFVDTPLLEKLPDKDGSGNSVRRPSRWLATTPEKVARKIVKAIPRNKRLVLATPLAHCLYHFKRLFPGTFDFVQSFKSSKIKNLFRRKKQTSPESNVEESRKAA